MIFRESNLEAELEKNRDQPLTPDFLAEQIRLPKDQWDERFSKLIEQKIRENQQVKIEEKKESPEILFEKTYRRYSEGLGLNDEILRNKKIIDLGTGSGEFVKYLIENGITKEAYGIDIQLDESLIEEKFKSHLLHGNFEKDLPIQNADYIISLGAVSNAIWCGEETMNIRSIIEKALASLKEDGEIRIYPIQEAAKATPLEGLEASRKKWDELLKEISETLKIEYKIEPRNIKVSGKNNDIILESVLIIKRKKN